MQKEKSGAIRSVRGVLAGALTAVLIMLVLCVLGAVLLSKQVLPESAEKYMVWIICVVGALVGCSVAQRRTGGARLPACLACAAAVCLIMLGMHAVLDAGSSFGFTGVGLTAGASVLSALLGASGKRRR